MHRPSSPAARATVWWGCIWALGGCAGIRPPSGPAPEASALFASLVGPSRSLKTLSAEADIEYYASDGRARLRAVLLAARPDRFRIEVLSPFREPLDIMASDGTTLWWLSRTTWHVGPATAGAVSRLLPVPLAPDGLVDVLLGGVPEPADWDPVAVEGDDDPRAWRLELRHRAEPRDLQIWVDPNAPRVLRAQLDGVDVRFSRFEAVGESDAPTRLQIRTSRVDLSIRMRDVDFGHPPDPSVFVLRPPEGAEVEPLIGP
ncbi:MAG: outer membrane lipoprotein carrier protein LolA [Myxococcota bacterium]